MADLTSVTGLMRYVYSVYSEGPREGTVWLMGMDWLNALRRANPPYGGGLVEPCTGMTDMLMGIPVVVRPEAGAPRLVPAGVAGWTWRDLPDGELACFRILRYNAVAWYPAV